jgi:LysM repeat protein
VRVVLPIVALVLAVVAGGMIAGLSQMAAPGGPIPRGSGVPAPSIEGRRSPTVEPGSPRPTATAASTPTASPTPTAVPTTVAEETWQYTIAPGDTISLVAIRYGTTTERLLELNPRYQADRDRVEIGEELVVPCTPAAVEEDRCG